MTGGMPLPSMPNVITPGEPLPPIPASMEGEGVVSGPAVPGNGPVISIRTDEEAMLNDGIPLYGGMGGRPVRRNPFRRNFGGGQGMGPMMPMAPRYTPMEGGNGGNSMPNSPHQQITITKLE
jgi:hypothetical protein